MHSRELISASRATSAPRRNPFTACQPCSARSSFPFRRVKTMPRGETLGETRGSRDRLTRRPFLSFFISLLPFSRYNRNSPREKRKFLPTKNYIIIAWPNSEKYTFLSRWWSSWPDGALFVFYKINTGPSYNVDQLASRIPPNFRTTRFLLRSQLIQQTKRYPPSKLDLDATKRLSSQRSSGENQRRSKNRVEIGG